MLRRNTHGQTARCGSHSFPLRFFLVKAQVTDASRKLAQWRSSAFPKTHFASGGTPPLGNEVDPSWPRGEQREELPTGLFGAFGDHFHPAVREVAGGARQTELERPRPGPPAEAHPLDLALHERCQADRLHGDQTRDMLALYPCRKLCNWVPTAPAPDAALFACTGCGSEWTRSEAWSPSQADGTVPVGVHEERQRGSAT